MYPIYNVWLAEEELKQMHSYLKFLEKSLADFEANLEKQYSIADLDKVIMADGEAAESIEYEKYIDLFSSVLGDFPRRHFVSFVISWYSFIEETLLRLCKDLKLSQQSDDTSKDNGIRLAKKLLRNENIRVDNVLWNKLLMINKLRNKLVHNGGIIPISLDKNEKKHFLGPFTQQDFFYYIDIERNFYKYLMENDLLIINQQAVLNPQIKYCYHLIDFGKMLLFDVFTNTKMI